MAKQRSVVQEAAKAAGPRSDTSRTLERPWTTLKETAKKKGTLAYLLIALWVSLTILLAIAKIKPA